MTLLIVVTITIAILLVTRITKPLNPKPTNPNQSHQIIAGDAVVAARPPRKQRSPGRRRDGNRFCSLGV